MKKINLIEWLSRNSHEKQSPQRFGRYAVMLIMLLTLGVGQMWGEPWIWSNTSGGNKGTKTVGDKLNGGSEWNYDFAVNGGWDDGWVKTYVGTSTSHYKEVGASWNADWNESPNKSVRANIGNVQFDESGKWYAVGAYNPDGGSTIAYTTTYQNWTKNTTLSFGSNSEPYWTVNPPAVSSFSVARSGYLAGSGTSEDPYLVASGSTLTLTGSGSQAISDANSSVNYKFGSDAYSTTATKNITVTSSGYIAVKARCINSSTSLNGTETSAITIHYAPVSVKDITVYIYVGGCTDGQINSLVLTANPYVGSKALPGVNIPAASFTTDGVWRKYTFTNVSEVQHVVVAREGGRAVNDITITDDVYYKYEGGEPLSGKCIARTTPTWNVAPANGAAGGSMTATINNVPAGATVTWSSSATSYATVNSSGDITYVAAGSATISARIEKAADGDYCALDETISQAITVTSGATVSATRACPEYVSTHSGQVKLDISSTGASTGWYYRVCNSAKTAYYAPDEQSAASNTLSWTMNGSLPTGSNTLVVELYNSARQLICTSSSVTVNVEIAESVTIAAGANGYVTPSGTVYANNNHVHPTITATPADEHYHFENWTSHDPQASVADANSATTTVTATASGYTITANFAGDQYRITYKDQSDVTYSGNNEGSLPATHTYGTATTLINGTKDGFTFGGWYTDVACTVSAGSSIGSTAKTSDFTLYAKWTEVMSTLSTSNSYSVGDPSFAAPTSSVSSIGISTTATVTAHANELGYALTGWTITGGTRTDGGAPNANPITVRSNGDGAAVSVTANYVGSNTPVNIFLPNTGNNWNTSDENWKFYKLPGEAGNTVTLAVNINKYDYSSSNYKLGFNIYHDGWTNKWWHNKSDGDSNMDAHSCTNWGFNTSEGAYRTYLDLNVSGTYTFTLTNSDNSGTQKLSVTYPDKSFIEGAFPTAWSEDAYTLTEDGDIQSVTINITSTGDKEFRLVSHGKLFGTSTKITAAANSQTLSAKNMADGGAVMTLAAYVTGEYTFTYNKSTKQLTVTFPIYNQVRISAASPEDETNVGNFNLSEPTENVRTVTRSLNANTTYTFKVLYESEWYGFDSGTFTRNSSTSSNSRTLTTSGGNMTLTTDYAGSYTFRFNQSTKNLSVDFPTAYTVTYGVGAEYSSMGNVTHNLSISSGDYVLNGTSMTFTATPNPGYKFVGWYSDDACTSSLSTDNPYTFSVTAEKTVYAKFELMDIKINSDVDGVWPVDWVQYIMSHSSGSPAVYTYSTTLTTRVTEQDEAPFNSGYHFNFLASNNDELYNFNNVQEPTYSGSSIDGVRKTADVNPTIQFGLTRKSDVTITLTLKTPPTKPTIHIAADPYYDIAYTAPSHGSYTIKVGDAEAVSDNTDARATTTITLANTPATGYHFGSWTVAKSASNVEVSNNQFTMPAENVTVSAAFTANAYSVHFNGNGNTGGSMSDQNFTYDAAQNLTANAFTKTGYTFAGWATEADGAVVYGDAASVSNLTDTQDGTVDLYAIWTPNNYTVTLNIEEANHGTIDDKANSASVTFDAAPTAIAADQLPTAAQGYAFMGFFTAAGGEGVQVINANGTWIASVTGYTDGDAKWVRDGDATLYAYYKKAEITALTITPSTAGLGATVTVTPTIDPMPTGTYQLCWKLLRNNDNEITGTTFTLTADDMDDPNAVQFTAPGSSGNYKVKCILRTGSSCDGGEELDNMVQSFTVAGEHTVTIRYQDASGRTLAASTEVTGRPLTWSEAIAAPSITGYTFASWEAGDGIILSTNGTSELGSNTTTTDPVYVEATYAGNLTAVYNKKNVLYFNNTLGWEHVYVYFYSNGNYWNSNKNNSGETAEYVYGSGANTTTTNYSGVYTGHYGEMTRIAGTNIYYFDWQAEGWSQTNYVTFTKDDRHDYEWFDNTEVVRLADAAHYYDKPGTMMMYVPLTSVYEIRNRHDANLTKYYTEGYWMNYPENTGYTLKIFNKVSGDPAPVVVQDIPFEFTGDYTMPMSVTAELEAGRTYGYKIYRNDGSWFGNDGTMTNGASGDEGQTVWEFETGKNNCGLTTSAAGEYTFTLTYAPKSDTYYYLVGVHYPVAVGSYRLVYTDEATTLWSGHTKPANWYHPSRTIEKKDGAKDIISFYVSKETGANASIKVQYAREINASTGAITWADGTDAEHTSVTLDLSGITSSGVYNFHLTQADGSISVEKIEAYTGNYYIRTDCAGTTKWDNYRAADHQMTYSEFSKDRATNTFGELYTHYYMHWCPRSTNIKFVIANDYSMCITDTLENDLVDLGNMSSPGWLNSDGANPDYRDKYSANIRFMYDERTNKISRAYMSSSTNTDRKFLVLKSNTEFKNSDGTALNGTGESTTEGNYEAIFKDNEDWIYEREIKLTPGQKFKLYASYAQATVQEDGSQHFRGNYADNDWDNAANYVELVGGSGSACNARIVYDFKTNRLISAYLPDNDNAIEGDPEINADIMIIRNHQEAGQQITFNTGASLNAVQTVYGVMRFNRWILNNRQNPEDMVREHSVNNTEMNSHHPLITDPGSQRSSSERGLYWISFPFNVNLSEVFGFGTYGTHWIVMKYNGEERAKQGFWADSEGFWEYIWDRRGVVLEKGKGYVLALDLDRMKADDRTFWNNEIQQVELFFPSTATVGTIQQTDVNVDVPAWTCTIGPRFEGGDDRTKKDSHWNIIGVPSYANYNSELTDGSAIITWNANPETQDLPFLYEWNANDNTYTVQSGTSYPFKAMHAYYVQYHGTLHWSLASATPPSIVARRAYEKPQNEEFRLELQQNEKMVDQTFVKLSNDENASADFRFEEDLCKEFNSRKANIYTFIADVQAAGNTLPMSDQTTLVPVGVKTTAAGEYTFAMPEGTSGVSVVLIDNIAGTRTNLALSDYTVALGKGDLSDRFMLEIAPIKQMPTDIENVQGGDVQGAKARKVMVDGILYIVKDGKVFDARGAKVK